MKKTIIVLLITFGYSHGQDFIQSVNDHRANYKKEFLADEHSPVKKEDIRYLDFYAPDEAYMVKALITKTDLKPFLMMTYSGKTKEYKEYGTADFKINGNPLRLHVYQSLDLMKKDPKFNDYLFIPFKDFTNGVETYGGGRYLDFTLADISDGNLVIDFNKAYNPLCAYSEGYSCPIPPEENHLKTEIKAGEKKFLKDH